MPASTTLTIRIPPDTKRKLERVAASTRRSQSVLAAAAISTYVERELDIIEGIRRGLADVEAGRVVPHEQVTAEARRVIAETRRGKPDPG